MYEFLEKLFEAHPGLAVGLVVLVLVVSFVIRLYLMGSPGEPGYQGDQLTQSRFIENNGGCLGTALLFLVTGLFMYLWLR